MTVNLENYDPLIQEQGINTAKNIKTTGDIISRGKQLTISATQITTVDASALFTVGQRAFDTNGNEYVYLNGVASCAVGDWVVYTAAGAVGSRLYGTGLGSVAVALAAVDASHYGWFQIYGLATATVVATGGVRLYTNAVTGQALATVVTGGLIHGAVTIAGNGNTVTGSTTSVQIAYPFVDRASGSY